MSLDVRGRFEIIDSSHHFDIHECVLIGNIHMQDELN